MMIVFRLLMRAALGFRLFRKSGWKLLLKENTCVMYLNENMHCIGGLARGMLLFFPSLSPKSVIHISYPWKQWVLVQSSVRSLIKSWLEFTKSRQQPTAWCPEDTMFSSYHSSYRLTAGLTRTFKKLDVFSELKASNLLK